MVIVAASLATVLIVQHRKHKKQMRDLKTQLATARELNTKFLSEASASPPEYGEAVGISSNIVPAGTKQPEEIYSEEDMQKGEQIYAENTNQNEKYTEDPEFTDDPTIQNGMLYTRTPSGGHIAINGVAGDPEGFTVVAVPGNNVYGSDMLDLQENKGGGKKRKGCCSRRC